MKNRELVDRIRSGQHANARLVDFIIQAHTVAPEAKQSRTAYQKQLNKVKEQLKYFSKNKSRQGIAAEEEEYMDEEFVFPKPVTLRTKTVEVQTRMTGSKTLTQDLQNQNKILEGRLDDQQSELKRKLSQVKYYSDKGDNLKDQLSKRKKTLEENETIMEELREDIRNKDAELNDALQENEWLREMVEDSRETVQTKNDRGNFTVAMQECSCKLLNYNVPQEHVGGVISTALTLAGKKASHIPSKSTVNEWNIMRRSLAVQQLAEEIPEASHLGILADELSKYGKKIEGYHAADETGRLYVLGLRNIASKAGHDVLTTFRDILRDIDDLAADSRSDASKQILYKIVSTMSDRAATQKKFNELLEAYRIDILPEMMSNYEALSEEERKSAGKLCNFFCGLHALVHLAETASAALLQVEEEQFDDPPIMDKFFRKAKEPGTTRLVRTTCKAMAEGGDEKSGCHGSFLEYVRPTLQEDGFKRLPLDPFRGNRFNILFQNAAKVFYLAESITQYLEGGATNRLLKAVLYDIKVPEYLAGCKALGLVSYLVTMPLWASIEDTSIHLLDIGKRYQEIIDFLTTASASDDRLNDFIHGDLRLSFANVRSLETSVIFQHLVQNWEFDEKVIVILKVMLPAMARLLQNIFSDHLEGGKWTNPSDEERERLSGLPKHNKFSESIFGHLDHILKTKPNISTIASEACIMFSHNKTSDWLAAKSEAEKVEIFTAARRSVKGC